MPKQKTHRASAKRFKKTGTGKLKRSHSERSHRFHGKTKKQRRQHKQPALVHAADMRRIKQMLDTH